MSGLRSRIAQGLVATTVLCALGFLVCGAFAARGNAWETACIALMIVMLGSMAAALGLVVFTYVSLRLAVNRYLCRPPLSDEEFAALLTAASPVDSMFVGRVRALAERHFGSLGGGRFHPGDRIEQDLHLADLAPFACEKFCAAIEQDLGLQADRLAEALASARVRTFGEIVAVAFSLADAPDAAKSAESPLETPANPLWDPALDAGPTAP
jgi:hypothetical protein